jgi:hypothetical protein
MSESYIEVSGTDKKLETAEFTNGNGDIVQREGVFLASPIDGVVKSSFGPVGGHNSSNYGLNVVTNEPYHSPARDAFGRWRVSNPLTLFDSTMQYDKGRLAWQETITGSATSVHDADGSCIDIAVTANSADKVTRQTREYMRYQPGKSQAIVMTFVFGNAVSGVEKCAGYYDDENGILFQQGADGSYNFVLRSSVSGTIINTVVPQADWNLDKLDGTGPSRITGDPTKGNILYIDLQWLSVGRVRCGFEFDGQVVYAHEFLHAGIISAAYMTTANLPLQYEISSDGTGGGSFKTICSSVMSEGGFELGRGNKFGVGLGTAALLKSVTTRVPLISIRPKLLFNSITNRGLILPDSVSAFSKDKFAYYEVIWGGTLTGGAFASADDDSIVEYDTTATAISGGICIATDYIEKKSNGALSGKNRYPITLLADGTHPTLGNNIHTDILTVVGTSLEATATKMGAALTWTEIR